MTCWLSACRSAISVDACSSRAPADRRLSASEPLSSATAKNPNTLSATVYCATERGGSDDRRRRPATDRRAMPDGGQVLREHEADVEQRAQRRHQQAAAPELDDARGDDRQHVERREVAGDAAGEVDERRDDQRVAGQLQVDQPAVPVDEPQRRRVDDRQRVGERRSGRRTGRPGTIPARVICATIAAAEQHVLMTARMRDQPGDACGEDRCHASRLELDADHDSSRASHSIPTSPTSAC